VAAVPLHDHLPGPGPVDHPGLAWEAIWVESAVQDERAEPCDGLRIAGPEVSCELVDAFVVLPCLADGFSRRGPVCLLPLAVLLASSQLFGCVSPTGVLECRTRFLLFASVSGRACSPAESAGRVWSELLP
jgi:hypothetical protein